jgi:hypothetical protein
MEDSLYAIIAGFLGLLLGELRRRQALKGPISVNPPPPDSAICKRCFFFRKFANSVERSADIEDTQLIHRMRFGDEQKGNPNG